MNIGLIGAENFHSKAFAGLFNEQKLFEGFTASYICGADDPEKCAALEKEFNLIHCDSEEEVIEKSDAVMITYRRGSDHAAAAKKALKARKPVFIDKPFTADVSEAEELIKLAKETGTPLCGGSTLKVMPIMQEIKDKIKEGMIVTIDYNADPESMYDGYYYYSPHAVELAMFFLGEKCKKLYAARCGTTVTANLLYEHNQCLLLTSPIKEDLHIRLTGSHVEDFTIDIGTAYRYGAEEFVQMIKTGKPMQNYSFYVESVKMMKEIMENYESNR